MFDPIVHLGASGTCDFLHRVCPACVVSRESPRPLRLLHRVCPALRGVPCTLSAVGHLPESVAGAAVFDPMPRRGFGSWFLRPNSNVIRWSMYGDARITSGTIFRSG